MHRTCCFFCYLSMDGGLLLQLVNSIFATSLNRKLHFEEQLLDRDVNYEYRRNNYNHIPQVIVIDLRWKNTFSSTTPPPIQIYGSRRRSIVRKSRWWVTGEDYYQSIRTANPIIIAVKSLESPREIISWLTDWLDHHQESIIFTLQVLHSNFGSLHLHLFLLIT